MTAIESVRRQTYADIEIIVVNDASRDERYYTLTEDVMFIHLPYNLGRPGIPPLVSSDSFLNVLVSAHACLDLDMCRHICKYTTTLCVSFNEYVRLSMPLS
jgi:hypothetical protein